MERLSGMPTSTVAGRRVRWTLRKWMEHIDRSIGVHGLAMGVALLVAAVMATLAWNLERQARQRNAELARLPVVPTPPAQEDTARQRLAAFQAALLPADRVPTVLQDLVQLADRSGLQMLRGDYRPVADPSGLFVRYAMSLPVTGDTEAVQRFLEAALRAQPMLSIESVQIQRERLDSRTVQARIQWVLFLAPVAPSSGSPDRRAGS